MKREKKRDGDTPNEALLRAVVSAFTRHAKAFHVKTEDTAAGELISFRVHQDDHPHVVGGMGKHIQALRTIFQFIGARDGKPVKLFLLEPKVGERGPREPFVANLDWKPDEMKELLEELLGRILTGKFKVDISSAEETTMVELSAERGEQEILESLSWHLQPIFHVIGKYQGRQVYLEAKRDVPTAKKAPAKR